MILMQLFQILQTTKFFQEIIISEMTTGRVQDL